MRVLFIVHVEEMFRGLFPLGLLDEIIIQAEGFDRVIALVSCIEDMEPVWEIKHIFHAQWEWGWGYEPCTGDDCDNDCWECEQDRWIISANGHEYTLIPQELRNGEFSNAEIFIGGGFDAECLQDFRDVLDCQDLDYTEVRDIIY